MTESERGLLDQFLSGSDAPCAPGKWDQSDRRQADRYRYVKVVEVIPVADGSDEPIDPLRIRLVAHNISTTGISIVARRPIKHAHFQIRLTRDDGRSIVLLTKLLRVSEVGEWLHRIAGEFVRIIEHD